ncbi:DNA-directed RNA polymerase [Novosphingobium sp.]|uniref:DNA-directed RNA polymerase n=1 Tax=Novosphingobium sp. TaxID=1874826 RepID=UPI003B517FFB
MNRPQDETLRDRQRTREAAARDAALGKRAKSIAEGHLGPVLKRWINAGVVPIAALLREVAQAYIRGDMGEVAVLLDTPTAELSARERPLLPLMEWCLRGKSPGRAETTTHAEDLVLAFMASTLNRVAQDKATLSSSLCSAADCLRDTVHGQFIVSIQGATAMQALRERSPELWQQKKSLRRISSQLLSQVRPQLQQAQEDGSLKATGKHVLKVLDHRGELRRIDLVPPDETAWEILALCFREEGNSGTPESRNLWIGFAGLLLSCAQKTGGWFEVAENRVGRKGHTRTTKLLVLSEKAHEAISKDVERWMGLGFYAEPMVAAPEQGDYLTVKHRKITGQRPPKGLVTDPENTDAWEAACILADTPWTINPYALAHFREHPEELAEGDTAAVMRLAEHRRLAGEDAIYLPTSMDFRGRLYYRPAWCGPQSADMGKSLLCFPLEGEAHEGKLYTDDEAQTAFIAFVMHMGGLYGNKVDKAPLIDRLGWWSKWNKAPTFEEADKPLTLRAHHELGEAGQTDRIPIQLDGTCNGLQHLSALFRDEGAAGLVNLTASTLNEPPADLYGKVAEIVLGKWEVGRTCESRDWEWRFNQTGLKIDRKLCKGPVMVLPYGGTREAVRLAVKTNVLAQIKDRYGTTCALETPWGKVTEANYAVFRDRDLHDHPLFNTDVGLLSGLIWESIAPAIPKAMAAMATLQAIGGFVGERGLSWRVGTGDKPLWVTQAKSKASRKQVTMRGFHLPDMVRRLTLMSNSNEVDPKAHRSGIVANFIHSLDAAHLSRALVTFRARGGDCVGAVHDCLLVRPSQAGLMGTVLRDSFVELYEADPLMSPVRLIPLDGSPHIEYLTWHELAEAAGVAFPDRGSFDITEVRKSAWFFS